MLKQINKAILVSMLTAVIYILFGTIMIISPQTAIGIIATLLGGIIGVIGLIFVLKYIIDKTKHKFSVFGLSIGIVLIIFSLLMFFKHGQIAMIIPIILGIIISVNAAIKLEYIISQKNKLNSNWFILTILAVVEIVLGLVLMFNPFESSLAITQIIGIFVIAYAVVDIIESIMLKIEIKKMKKEFDNIVDELQG